MSDASEYRITVQRRETEDGMLFEGTVTEFPDVAVYSESAEEAYQEVLDVIEGLRELFDKHGREMPLPMSPKADYSGRFIVRVPKSLHRNLAETAELEGVSLNQYVVSVLSAAPAFAGTRIETELSITQSFAETASGNTRAQLKMVGGRK
jgi:predicted HicB family RNase H-like nuclease